MVDEIMKKNIEIHKTFVKEDRDLEVIQAKLNEVLMGICINYQEDDKEKLLNDFNSLYAEITDEIFEADKETDILNDVIPIDLDMNKNHEEEEEYIDNEEESEENNEYESDL